MRLIISSSNRRKAMSFNIDPQVAANAFFHGMEQHRAEAGGRNHLKLPTGVSFFSPKVLPEINKLVFLPYLVKQGEKKNPMCSAGTVYYTRYYYAHRRIGGSGTTVVCPTSIGKPCPICKHVQELCMDYTTNREQIKLLRKKDRQIFNVIDLSEEKKTIKVFESSTFCFGEILETTFKTFSEADRKKFGVFFLPEGGYIMRVAFKKTTSEKGNLIKAERIDFEPRSPIKNEIIERCVDLDAILEILPYAQLEKILKEGEGEEEIAEEESKGLDLDDVDVFNPEKIAIVEPETPKKEKEAVVIDAVENNSEDPFKKEAENVLESLEVVDSNSMDGFLEEKKEAPKEKKEVSKESNSKCPHGHAFGSDCGNFSECQKCKLSNECAKACGLI